MQQANQNGSKSTPSKSATTTCTESPELSHKFNQVTSLISDAISSTNGSCAPQISSAVLSALKRAKTKAKMLPHIGSPLVLAALDEISWEVAACLSEPAALNAELMRQLTENHPSAPKPNTPEQPIEANTSVITQFGDLLPGNVSSIEDQEVSEVDSSVMTQLIEGGENSDDQRDLESTAGSKPRMSHRSTGTEPSRKPSSLSPADIMMQPLLDFCVEIQTVAGIDAENANFRKSLKLKKPTSGDLKLARELDFDHCSSPKRRDSTPLGTPTVRGSCFEYGLDSKTNAIAVKPLYQDVDQFSPMASSSTTSIKSAKCGEGVRSMSSPVSRSSMVVITPFTGVCKDEKPPGLLPHTHVEGGPRSIDDAEEEQLRGATDESSIVLSSNNRGVGVGEPDHGVPPIASQVLNLSLQ